MTQRFYKQPSVEELKRMNVFITHITPDEPPKEGLKRMIDYYTQLEGRPNDEFYHMQSYRRPFLKDEVIHWVKTGQIIPLKQKIILPWSKELWLATNNDIFLLNAYDPKKIGKEYKTAKPIANMQELKEYTQKHLDQILENM